MYKVSQQDLCNVYIIVFIQNDDCIAHNTCIFIQEGWGHPGNHLILGLGHTFVDYAYGQVVFDI